jgi:hypothetical protein
VKAAYHLAHPVGPVDCVDLKRSEISFSAVAPDEARSIRRLVLDAARVPEDRTIFRIKEYAKAIIVRSDLVQRLHDAGVGGFELLDLDAPIMI